MYIAILAAALAGCVVPYGEPPVGGATAEPLAAATPAADLTSLEARLLLLMDENHEADRARRLDAARRLLRHARTWDADAQRDLVRYLEALLDVEERFRDEQGTEAFQPLVGQGPVISDPLGPVAVPIQEEHLGAQELSVGPASLAAEETGSGPSAVEGADGEPVTVTPERDQRAVQAEVAELARQALAESRYQDALVALDELPDLIQDEALLTLRGEAMDGLVHQERERAGRLFLQSRELEDPDARLAGYQEVKELLEGLIRDYPDSSYASAIARNLQLVERELAGGE